ncbi:Fe-S protein assembly co-chaperone HscB [Kwoniella sp. DSM 27419]
MLLRTSAISPPRALRASGSARPPRLIPCVARPASSLRPTSSIRHNSTDTASRPAQKCPSCSEVVALPTSPCPSCANILPLPSTLSHHSMLYLSQPVAASASSTPAGQLDIPAELAKLPGNGYKLDKGDLRRNWLMRQRDLHPDKYSARGDRMVDLARELSGRVNEAYNVLGDELKRAEYLLSVHAHATEETDKIDDPMMLAEILEAREELEEATTQQQVDSIRAANHEKVVETINSLVLAFSENPPNLSEAKDLAVQLRYWRGLEDAAREKAV